MVQECARNPLTLSAVLPRTWRILLDIRVRLGPHHDVESQRRCVLHRCLCPFCGWQCHVPSLRRPLRTPLPRLAPVHAVPYRALLCSGRLQQSDAKRTLNFLSTPHVWVR